MKKAYITLLIFIMSIGLAACGCDHEWKEADCLHPKTCIKCGEEEGETLAHETGDWEKVEADYAEATQRYVRKCPVCGTVTEEKIEPLTSLVNGSEFYLTPEEFERRMDTYLNQYLNETELAVATGSFYDEDGIFCYNMEKDGKLIGTVYLINLQNLPSVEEYQHFQIATAAVVEGEYVLGGCLFRSLIRTLDPAIDDTEIERVTDQIMTNEIPYVENNGLAYAVSNTEEGIISLYITPVEPE